MVQSLFIFVFAVACIHRIASLGFTDIDFDKLAKYLEADNVSLSDSEMQTLRLGLTYPGTKWCGLADTAADYDDLGSAAETDTCCRAHDNCPDFIRALQSRHNLTNIGFYKRLHCHCDNEFHQCLLSANTTTSKQIGVIYFNLLFTKCYREDYPVIGCNLRGGLFNSKCLEPEYNTSGEMVYQWFDVPNY